MKKLFILPLILLLYSCVTVTGSVRGKEPSTNHTIISNTYFEGQRITGINLNSMCTAEVTQGSTNSVEITYSDYLKEYLKVELKNGVLYISCNNRNDRNNDNKKYVLSARIICSDLSIIKLNGMSTLKFTDGSVKTNDLTLNMNGMSKLASSTIQNDGWCDITVNGMSECNASINSSSKVELSLNGMSKYGNSISSNGELVFDVNGMSTLTTSVTTPSSLKVTISGMSNGNISGKTENTTIKCTGMSKVHTEGLRTSNSSNIHME